MHASFSFSVMIAKQGCVKSGILKTTQLEPHNMQSCRVKSNQTSPTPTSSPIKQLLQFRSSKRIARWLQAGLVCFPQHFYHKQGSQKRAFTKTFRGLLSFQSQSDLSTLSLLFFMQCLQRVVFFIFSKSVEFNA